MRKHRIAGRIIGIAILLFIVIAGFGQAVLHLWNWLMPAIFQLPAITYWQALGLMALSWLLFGGLRGFRGPGRRSWRRRWERMTPEQRELFRKGMQNWGAQCGRQTADPQAKA